jgi:hypothetical protein
MSLTARLSLPLALAVALLGRPWPARAESSQSSAAGALFRAGREAMERGETAEACAKFEESQRLESAPGTQLNLAVCEAKLGRLARALELFRTVRERLTAGDFRLAFIDQQSALLSNRVALITLVLPNDAPPDVRVECDGVALGAASMGVALPVDPGRHFVVVRAWGREDRRFEWVLGEGERRVVAVGPGPGIAAGAPADGSSRRTWGWVALSLGGAGVAVGVVAGAMTVAAANTYKDHCSGGQCDASGLDAASTGRSVQIVSPVSLAVGAVGLAAGAYLLLSAPRSNQARASVLPLLGAGLAGVAAAGGF